MPPFGHRLVQGNLPLCAPRGRSLFEKSGLLLPVELGNEQSPRIVSDLDSVPRAHPQHLVEVMRLLLGEGQNISDLETRSRE